MGRPVSHITCVGGDVKHCSIHKTMGVASQPELFDMRNNYTPVVRLSAIIFVNNQVYPTPYLSVLVYGAHDDIMSTVKQCHWM